MPARKRKKLPTASKRKRLLHAFYLAQPFLQFFALMTVFFVLSRCSPLAPSSNRNLNKTSSDGVIATRSEKAQSLAEEEDINSVLHEISDLEELPVLTQSEFQKLIADSLQADKPVDSAAVGGLLQKHARQKPGSHNVKILTFNLSSHQRLQFFQGAPVRLNLSDRLSAGMKPEVRKAFLLELRKISALQGRLYLVNPDDPLQDEDPGVLPLRSKLQLGFLSDEKVFLQIKKVDQRLDDEQQKLIDTHQKKALFLAVVLE